MLNGLFIISYYGFIRTYWTAKQNAARTNIDLAFTRTAFSALAKHQTDNDTAANQTLLGTEATAQSAFLTATQGNRAGVVTDEELATSLTAYKTAKANRRVAIPNCQIIIDSIEQQAQETFELFQLQYNNKVNAKPFFGQDEAAHQSELDAYKSYLIYAQSLRDTAADFAEKLNAYVTMSEQKLDVIETTGKAPETYQDIIDASNYTFDGTYSDAVNHIAPTGQLYGQTTIVQQITHRYWWAGERWYRIPDEVDQAASAGLLPSGEPFGTIFRIPSARYNATTSSYEWDYYLSTGDGWELMTEYWEIDGVNNLPATGYKVGDYHKVIERAVPVMWNGFEPQRLNISAFIDDVGITTGMATIVSKATELRGDHNELLEDFFGFQDTTAQNLVDITKFANITDKQLTANIAKLITDINSFTVDTSITETEANNLELDVNQIVAETNKVLAIATELGITTEKTAYESALSQLQEAIAVWVNQPSYPLTYDSQDKVDILFYTTELEEKRVELHSALEEKFDGTVVDYTVEQIDDVNDSINNLETDLSKFTDDGFITFPESKALKISMVQLTAESTDLIAIATGLGITTEKTAYVNALAALELELSDWVGLSEASYPVAVIANDRTQINNALALVKSTRDTLSKKIRDLDRDYVDGQISDVNEALGQLQTDINNSMSDGYITYIESVSLKTSLATANNESTDLVAVATSLGITTEKTNYSTALTNLSNAISPWIDRPQAEYPKAVTSNQRADIIVRLESVQNTKSILVNEIIRKRQEDVAQYLNNQIADANSSQTALYNEWNTRTSDDSVTQAEAASLRLVIAQYQNEVDGLKAIAESVDLDALALTYYNAAQALVAGINAIINSTYSYPVTVTSNQKSAIEALFVTAKSTKKALIDALTATGEYGVGSTGFDVSQFRRVYDGFVRGFTPELRLVYISQNELSLQPNYGDFDYLKVNDQNIEASKRTSVFTFTPVLGWNEEAQSLYTSLLQADTEYWVYLANRDDRFQTDVPGGVYDYRGRLFCSGTSPSNNYLGEAGLGLHAILIGKAETDSNTKFRHELDVSLISRQSDTKETFREFSDFDLKYTDENTLTLERIYGTYGQIYVPESLYYLGENREVYTTSPRIEVDVNENLVYDTAAIAANTLYYIYLAGDSDIFNFNEINTVTNLPWHPEDSDPTPSLYDADKDFRLWLFLSTKEPEEGRLAETYAGYWARHIGQVRTDGTGKFIYSGGVSAIRQATLNPTYFDGLAEISLQDVSTTSFKVIRKRGTSGIVMVGSKGVLTYDADNPLVHTITTSDTVYAYNEATPSSPLSPTGTILDIYIGRSIHLYLANDRPCWGSLVNRTFLSNEEPTDAYLSQNFPGNNARWIAEIQLAAGTKGAELVTNGNFEDSNDWDGHGGWGWSEANLNACHNTGNTSSLDQISMTVVAGGTYEVAATVSSVWAGSITPKLGNTLGTAITSAQRSIQYIIATNTDVLKFVPTTDFNGAVDTVSCKKVEHGAFTGSYMVDSIAKQVPYIDDTIVSSNVAWSSQKIMQVINDALGVSGTTAVFNAQKTGGLNLRLEYVDTTTVRLIPASGQDSYVVFPDLSFRTIPAAGITLTVSGSANTRYYVYLTSSSFYMSTTAPDNFYTKLETLGTATIQVGDICMTSTNTMSGAWNVCSSHQEPSREWSQPIDSASETLSLPGLIQSKRSTGSISRTGSSSYTTTIGAGGASYDTQSGTGTVGTQDHPHSYVYPTRGTLSWIVQTVITLAGYTNVEGINNSPTFGASISSWVTATPFSSSWSTCSYTSHNGNLILTRSQP